MQRAAASAATKAPQSPAAEEDQRSSKRPRLSTEPSSPVTPQSDLEAISAALAAEEEKRREAIARQAAEAGESEWVLDIPAANYNPRPIVLAADSLDAEDEAPRGGRRAYGNFMRKKPVSLAFREYIRRSSTNSYYKVPVVETKDEDKESEGLQHRKAPQADGDKRLSNLTSISGGMRPAASPRFGSDSSKRKKKHKR